MRFDTKNMIFTKVMMDRSNVDDNKILLVSGIISGSPLLKFLIPFQMIKQAEESASSEEQTKRAKDELNKELVDIDAIIAKNEGGAETTLKAVSEKMKAKKKAAPAPVLS